MNETSGSYLAPALAQLAALAIDENITRAAERSGTSQPTLSRSVRAWEQDLGITLLVRRGRGVELSDDGRILAAAAAASLHTLDQALGRIRGTVQEAPLTVGFLRSLGPTVAGELIASFLVSRPNTVIVHREGSSTDLLDWLDESRIDVAITSPRPPDRFSWLPIGEQALVLVVPSGHRLANATTVRLSEVRDDPFLALDSRFDARQRSDSLCAAAGFTPRIVLEADDFLTVRGYVATGMGVAVLPADASLSPRTVSIPLSDPNAHRTFGLAWDPSKVVPPTAALLAHTQELARKYPQWADILA
ncbi:LysR family transcriptional regulator [Leifsonia poae]|uniref:LysR family transcriptional regulator n=1 Tax=Leifsonia poae TaxID=110933 RepID=A0A9W6M1N1_9MICO|nr:LysR family transcriptional regulator [Leifsonia poae]GLJ78061.1 LysR family transcriptional regulator [Leifsonia poae]